MPVTETGSDLSRLKINVMKRNYFSNYSCEEELTLQWHLADLWMEDYMFSLHPRWEIGKKKAAVGRLQDATLKLRLMKFFDRHQLQNADNPADSASGDTNSERAVSEIHLAFAVKG